MNIDTENRDDNFTRKLLAIAATMKKEARVRRHIVDFPCYTQRATIYAPEGRTVDELYILAHECGHAAHRHRG
jgi:hypothetical protein